MNSLKLYVALVAVLVMASSAFGNATDELFGVLSDGKFTLKQVQSLVNDGADVNAKDNTSHTPLMYVSNYCESPEQLDVVKFLLESGADVNAKDKGGNTALMFASISSLVDVMKTLIDAGAEVEARNDKGHTPLRLNFTMFPTVGAVNLLIKAGANVNSTDNSGVTSLMAVARLMSMRSVIGEKQIDIEVVKALISAGADPSMKDRKGKTLWDYARNDEVKQALREVIR